MRYTTLGKTQLKVSALGLGCWAFAGGTVWGNQEEKDSINTIRAAIDVGITFFDTAEKYGDGHSEEVLGQGLKGCRHQVVVASKVYSDNLTRENVIKSCEQSLKRLNTDYLDLYQIHWPSRSIPLEETMAAFDQLVQQGKVRTVGVCNFGVQDMESVLKLSSVVSNQLPYSLLWQAIEQEILPKCKEKRVGVIAYSPLCQGLLTGKYQSVEQVPPGLTGTRFYSHQRSNARHGEAGMEAETFTAVARIREICASIGESMGNVAISWVLNQPGISSVLVGARTPQQLQENIKATNVELSNETMKSLVVATEDLKAKVGDNPDMWEGKAKSRYR
ncbi:MAG: aldo/keto reductase [Anaerosporomusa subterranea]|jgi:aryl-alcohol dehydrogenase-like predicted oxidoreductase|nr:aldo/keto reductase [Anaerosporomusa subterranea]